MLYLTTLIMGEFCTPKDYPICFLFICVQNLFPICGKGKLNRMSFGIKWKWPPQDCIKHTWRESLKFWEK
jgi:hypothetical protein